MSAFALHYLYKGSRDFSRVAAVFCVALRQHRTIRHRRLLEHLSQFSQDSLSPNCAVLPLYSHSTVAGGLDVMS